MEVVEEIKRLKKEKKAIILAHNYQRPEIHEIADLLGDSLQLSKEAAETDASLIVFCGVRFMAETAKILSPGKTVLLPRKKAGCPMADMVTVEELKKLKEENPGALVVSYVNTNADIKAETDVCCTSANARKVLENIDADKIIFVPDKNLAAYCQRFVKKEIIPWEGFCYVHQKFRKEELIEAKENFPEAVLVVHPECAPEVIDLADEVLSTGGMVKFARESDRKEFLIGTEEGIINRLKKENPEKIFYAAGTPKICATMKLTGLDDVLRALKEETHKIELPEETMDRARKALEEMLKYS